ncbi:IS200/IS605 family element transposase accessory protein TnpB [Enterococcus sp. 669A]|uniref:IS200/IS605 family element transposase accessory protein TnpB n=1 Tax=Candidatus Enterococcus moelleringii TaxID=2815325 RepID=A0ABS3L8L1_9ENTE|nr:IS200/IS605 family element RNA-guided endonuclease TnpB [Enterococcus sp. 669A]MBO1305968.1 IS200/IS605 family element transposase accessory protein TnpB [Enterococcus sp. 669A]
MKKAHKIRIYPNNRQQVQIQKTFGCVRFYWNFLLEQRMTNYKMKQVDENYQEDKTTYAALKKQEEYAWLKDVEAQALSQVAMDLNKAYKNTFKSSFGFPKFKSKKYSKKAYRTAVGMKVNGQYFYVAKVGWVKMAEILRFKGKLMNVTISQSKAGKYFASFLVETENITAEPVQGVIGIDLGLTHFCITSAGEKIENNHFYRSLEKRLGIEQRKLSRRLETAKKQHRPLAECKNYQKQKLKVARIHEKIANQRTDFLHQLSSRITDENQIICIEDLNVKGLIKNHKLAKSISDVSWHEFVRQLTYKSEWKGRTLIKIDRFFPSSQICSSCGHNDGKKELNIREWTCTVCGTTHDRDINASINIRTEGLSGIA